MAINERLKEQLSAAIYRVWARWMTQMFSKGRFDVDGRWVMPMDICDEYTERLTKKYDRLTDDEKAWFRSTAKEVLNLFWLHKGADNDN
ncbi:MAG: hypothetical protein Q8M94_01080 [Ignavibacteria bacterium]|nr:hypothetical protein [Ignavibacteria bacterium]